MLFLFLESIFVAVAVVEEAPDDFALIWSDCVLALDADFRFIALVAVDAVSFDEVDFFRWTVGLPTVGFTTTNLYPVAILSSVVLRGSFRVCDSTQ